MLMPSYRTESDSIKKSVSHRILSLQREKCKYSSSSRAILNDRGHLSYLSLEDYSILRELSYCCCSWICATCSALEMSYPTKYPVRQCLTRKKSLYEKYRNSLYLIFVAAEDWSTAWLLRFSYYCCNCCCYCCNRFACVGLDWFY